MKTLTSESTAGASSAREASRRLSLPPTFFMEFLNQYPYKLQSCHELLMSDTVEREAFARILKCVSSGLVVFMASPDVAEPSQSVTSDDLSNLGIHTAVINDLGGGHFSELVDNRDRVSTDSDPAGEVLFFPDFPGPRDEQWERFPREVFICYRRK
ncbi:hypothetical protein TNCV_4265581 [Trichonephila clavipes]|nr:hypothetical protein TNCV_4265581 [Trichonephila clavipes]